MRLLETRVENSGGAVRLVGVVEPGGARPRIEVYFSYSAEYAGFVLDSGDPFLPALLVPSLKSGEDLEIVPEVSPRLLRRVQRIQDILVSWHAPFRRVRVIAREREGAAGTPGNAVGAFFSGGVDSFYTLLKSVRGWPSPVPSITHLVFLKGLEQPLEICKDTEESRRWVEEVARQTGRSLIAGETNLRTHFTLNYELYYHGAALAAAALALAGDLRYILIPASDSYAGLSPWGSHPLLDELWSTERLEVVHDGAEAGRAEKLSSLVATDPLALEYLRVCLQNSAGPFNCGKCKKCVRTMVSLELLGMLPKARTFPKHLNQESEKILRLDAPEYVEELAALARWTSDHQELRVMLERVLRRRRRRKALRTLLETTPLLAKLLGAFDGLRGRTSAGEAGRR